MRVIVEGCPNCLCQTYARVTNKAMLVLIEGSLWIGREYRSPSSGPFTNIVPVWRSLTYKPKVKLQLRTWKWITIHSPSMDLALYSSACIDWRCVCRSRVLWCIEGRWMTLIISLSTILKLSGTRLFSLLVIHAKELIWSLWKGGAIFGFQPTFDIVPQPVQGFAPSDACLVHKMQKVCARVQC